MSWKSITTDELGRMVRAGFAETAMKSDVAEWTVRMENSFVTLNSQIDWIRSIVLGDYLNRLERLETRLERMDEAMRFVKTELELE